MDVVLLSRIQFALTVMFHYLFPPLTIGMGVVLVYLEAMYLKTKQPIYESAAKFWVQLYAVTFAVGVATGIVMEFQFGTNWAVYSRFVGDVFGAALAAEGIFAFFLESGFLAVLVYGWDKVSPRFHFISTIMVSIGSIFSAVWIIVANSWQQTPTGHHIVQMLRDGKPWFINGAPVMRAEVIDFWAVVFNPSTVNRLTHTLIGAFLMGAFFIMSISAYYLLRKRHMEFARRSFTGGLIFATIFSLAQLVSGHFNAAMVAKQQPAKLAAFEGHTKTGPADLSLFSIPDQTGKNGFSLSIPGGLSFLVHNDSHAPVTGLEAFPKEDWPPILMSFMSYHLMVGIGVFFIALTLFASFLRWRGKLFDQRWLMMVFIASVVLAAVANQLGWVAAEVGRQPWIVQVEMKRNADGWIATDAAGKAQYAFEAVDVPGQGVVQVLKGLRTSHAVSEAVKADQVLWSIIMFGLIYVLLGAVWVFVLNHKIHVGPAAITDPPDIPKRPASGGLVAMEQIRVEHTGSMSEAKDARTDGRD